MASRVFGSYGIRLQTLSHPSTTFSDSEVSALLESSGQNINKFRAEKPKVLFPGGPSEAKGFHLTASLAKELSEDIFNKIDFSVRVSEQSNPPMPMHDYIRDVRRSKFEVIDAELTKSDYSHLLSEADIIALPYDPKVFAERTSGLVVDAAYLGKPMIVLEGGWIADTVSKFGNGIIVTSFSSEEFVPAVNDLIRDYSKYSSSDKSKAYFSKNRWSNLVKQILDTKTQLKSGPIGPAFSRNQRASIDETHLVSLILADKPKGSVMIDVGGHHGSALAPFNRMGWDIFAFEPDPRNRKYLEGRFGGQQNVNISPQAVSNEVKSEVDFFSSSESTGISGLLKFRDTHKKTTTVETTTIREIAKTNDLSHIDFLKIDVEGFDYQVLQGVPWETLQPDVIECEFEDAKNEITWALLARYLRVSLQ